MPDATLRTLAYTLQIDLSEPGAEAGGLSVLFGTGLVLAGFLALLLVVHRLRTGYLDADAKHRVRLVRSQLSNWSGTRLVIPDTALEDHDRWRGYCWDALEGGSPVKRESVRDALGRVRQAWRSRTRGIPQLAVWLGGEALTLAGFAAIMAVSAAAIEDGVDRSVDPVDAVTTGLDYIHSGLVFLWEMFPGTEFLWALLLTGALETWAWMNEHPFMVAGALLAGAIGIALLERSTRDELEVRLYNSHTDLAKRVAAWAAVVYLVGAIPAGIAVRIGRGEVGGLVGALLAFAVALALLLRAGIDVLRRLRTQHPLARFRSLIPAAVDDGHELAISLAAAGFPTRPRRRRVRIDRVGLYASYLYLLLRKATALIGLVAVPVVLWYVGQAFWSGQLVALLVALVNAPAPTQIVVALALVVVVIGLLSLDPEAWRHVGDSLRRAGSQQAVQAALFFAVGPAIAGVAVTVLAIMVQIPLPVAIIAGAVVAVVVRLAYRAYRRVTLTTAQRERSEGRSSVVTEWGTIDHPDEEGVLYIGRVGMRWYAWPTAEELVSQVFTDACKRLRGDEVTPSLAARYYDELTEEGVIDVECLLDVEVTAAKRRCESLLAPDGGRVDRIEAELSAAFDDRIVDKATTELEEAGIISCVDNHYRWHGAPERHVTTSHSAGKRGTSG